MVRVEENESKKSSLKCEKSEGWDWRALYKRKVKAAIAETGVDSAPISGLVFIITI